MSRNRRAWTKRTAAYRAAAGLLAAAALAGCATTMPRPSFVDIRGMPIAVVTNRIGLPDSSFYVGDSKVYVWRREVTYRRPRFHPPTHYGWYGFHDDDYYTRSCTLKLVVDRDERVESWQRDGHLRICDSFAARLQGPPAAPPQG